MRKRGSRFDIAKRWETQAMSYWRAGGQNGLSDRRAISIPNNSQYKRKPPIEDWSFLSDGDTRASAPTSESGSTSSTRRLAVVQKETATGCRRPLGSGDAIPFTLYLNYDKNLVGLFIIGWGHSRIARATEWRAIFATAAPQAAGVIAVILGLSVAIGYVRFEPKFPAETWLWPRVNFSFVCLAEEALFRGFIQAQLQRLWRRWSWGAWLALAVAAVLFGLAHAAGGVSYVLLATVAGLGYGWIYQRTRRIEASILTHFVLNTVHFLAFTYPALQPAGER